MSVAAVLCLSAALTPVAVSDVAADPSRTAGVSLELLVANEWRCEALGACTLCRNVTDHVSAVMLHRGDSHERHTVPPDGVIRICLPRSA